MGAVQGLHARQRALLHDTAAVVRIGPGDGKGRQAEVRPVQFDEDVLRSGPRPRRRRRRTRASTSSVMCSRASASTSPLRPTTSRAIRSTRANNVNGVGDRLDRRLPGAPARPAGPARSRRPTFVRSSTPCTTCRTCSTRSPTSPRAMNADSVKMPDGAGDRHAHRRLHAVAVLGDRPRQGVRAQPGLRHAPHRHDLSVPGPGPEHARTTRCGRARRNGSRRASTTGRGARATADGCPIRRPTTARRS